MDTLKQFAENEKKQRIEAEKELHLQVCVLVYKVYKGQEVYCCVYLDELKS